MKSKCMKKGGPKLAIFILVFLSVCGSASAQKNTVWKKQVARILTIKERVNKPHPPKKVNTDSTLLEMIVNAAMTGKATAYSNIDHQFTTKLSSHEVSDIFYPKPDTTIIIDPNSREEKEKIIPRDFDFDAVNQYRILEDWTFNTATGTTDIHIAGIAPVKDVYIDAYTRSVQATFWIRYADIAPILARYEKKHPANSFTQLMWKDYFFPDKDIEQQSPGVLVLERRISRIYDTDPEDTASRHLKNMDADTSLYNTIYYDILSGKINAYDSLGSKILTNELSGIPDTTTVVDPITLNMETKVVPHLWLFDHKPKYRIVEDWRFDKATGNTKIKVAGIVPFLERTDAYYNTVTYWNIFWLRYDEVYSIVNQYEESHPGISLELQLWKDRMIK
jgi:hypothetical protein